MRNNKASEEEFRTDNLNSFYKVYNMFGPLQQQNMLIYFRANPKYMI